MLQNPVLIKFVADKLLPAHSAAMHQGDLLTAPQWCCQTEDPDKPKWGGMRLGWI